MSYNNFENTKEKIEKTYNLNKEVKNKINNFKIKEYKINNIELKYSQKVFERVFESTSPSYPPIGEDFVIDFNNLDDRRKILLKPVVIIEYKEGNVVNVDTSNCVDVRFKYFWVNNKMCCNITVQRIVGVITNLINYQAKVIIYYII